MGERRTSGCQKEKSDDTRTEKRLFMYSLYYTTLYKGLEHPLILVYTGAPRTNPPDTEGQMYTGFNIQASLKSSEDKKTSLQWVAQ